MNESASPCRRTIADLAGALADSGFDVGSAVMDKITVEKHGQERTIEVAPEKTDDPEAPLVCEVRANLGRIFLTDERNWQTDFITALDQHMQDPHRKGGF